MTRGLLNNCRVKTISTHPSYGLSTRTRAKTSRYLMYTLNGKVHRLVGALLPRNDSAIKCTTCAQAYGHKNVYNYTEEYRRDYRVRESLRKSRSHRLPLHGSRTARYIRSEYGLYRSIADKMWNRLNISTHRLFYAMKIPVCRQTTGSSGFWNNEIYSPQGCKTIHWRNLNVKFQRMRFNTDACKS